jgi:hypothetical protein
VQADGGPLVGANPQHDQNLLRLLYTLSELSGKPHYRAAADAEIKWFLDHARSPATDLLPWGEHMSWNTLTDEAMPRSRNAAHEFFRPWMLWDRSFDLAPEGARKFALGLWHHQIANHQTGAFDRHARYSEHGAAANMDFPRHAGFYIRTWAAAYARTHDSQFLAAIETLLGRFEQKRHHRTGLIESWTGQTNAWPLSSLSLAIDCAGAAHRVPEPLAGRLRKFAEHEDDVFVGLAHPVKSGGFLTTVNKATGERTGEHTPLWNARYGGSTTAQVGMMCVARYENTGSTTYRELIFRAADAYLDSRPAETDDIWPVTFGHAISLQIAAWRHSAKPAYLDRARAFADLAVEKFWGTNALPKASYSSDHYESITGADTLALALVELHLNILGITAVRSPANTIDR